MLPINCLNQDGHDWQDMQDKRQWNETVFRVTQYRVMKKHYPVHPSILDILIQTNADAALSISPIA